MVDDITILEIVQRKPFTAAINTFHLRGRGATHSQELDEGDGVRVSEKSKTHSMSKSADTSTQELKQKINTGYPIQPK